MSEQTFIRSSHKFTTWIDIWTLTWAEEIGFHIDIKESVLKIFRNTNPGLMNGQYFPTMLIHYIYIHFVLEVLESVTPGLDSDY